MSTDIPTNDLNNKLPDNQGVDRSLIFIGCSIALTVTAMTFAIRAGILGQLSGQYGLSDTQLGWITALALFGFPVATLFGGILYNAIGAKKLMVIAFLGHAIGLALTITAQGFTTLLISSFCIGVANGAVEAACNPMIADMYHKNKTTMLNRFHVWFPGGILIGALLSKFMTDAGLGWQLQIATMFIPTAAYGAILFMKHLPKSANIETSFSVNIKGLLSPLYLFMVVCMTLTATTELGTQQWVERILGASGASPMLVLALITGLMAVGRYFAGPLVHRLNPVGVLLSSAIASAIGIYALSTTTGFAVYFAAIIFALGVTYFWPTMIGFVAEYTPDTGAMGMSFIGAAGMCATGMWSPVIGRWIDDARLLAAENQLTGAEADLAAGQAALSNLAIFPTVLIFAFGGLYLYMRMSSTNTPQTQVAEV